MEKIKFGTPVLVEVHGLPEDKVQPFTYIASYPVTAGERVLVPAPEWSIRVTGRTELPGFVLGPSTLEAIPPFTNVRDIIPMPASPLVKAQPAVRALVERWYAKADSLSELSTLYNRMARDLEDTLDGEKV